MRYYLVHSRPMHARVDRLLWDGQCSKPAHMWSSKLNAGTRVVTHERECWFKYRACMPPQEEYKDLTKWWKEQLGSDVIGVKVSKRLANTPVVVVTSKHGWSANMERIMKAQVRGRFKSMPQHSTRCASINSP